MLLIDNLKDLVYSIETVEEQKAVLRLPVANNRGGLAISVLYGSNSLSLYDCFQQFFSHAWHYDIFFHNDKTQHTLPEVLFHVVAISIHKHNLASLRRDIEHLAFKEIRRPTTAINDRLHDKRADLVLLRKSLKLFSIYIPRAVRMNLENNIHNNGLHDRMTSDADSILFYEQTMADLELLETFLMDTFHLLISSTSVLEAEEMKREAKRTQTLTNLAFIYVPLSFVTGIFGMNVKEINGSQLSIWTFVVTLVVVTGLTGLTVLTTRWISKEKSQRRMTQTGKRPIQSGDQHMLQDIP